MSRSYHSKKRSLATSMKNRTCNTGNRRELGFVRARLEGKEWRVQRTRRNHAQEAQ